MKLHELRGAAGSRHPRKRIGRGIAAGQGKTAGRGQKGAGARGGAKVPRGFEGGQMKITMRLPKLRGFTNRWRAEYTPLNVGKLNRFPGGAIVDGASLAALGLVGDPGERVKLLAAGRLRVAVTVRVHRASAAARRAVEGAGGRVELLEVGRGDGTAPAAGVAANDGAATTEATTAAAESAPAAAAASGAAAATPSAATSPAVTASPAAAEATPSGEPAPSRARARRRPSTAAPTEGEADA